MLKTLPDEKQKELFEYLQEHTLAEAEEWLLTEGIETGRSALSSFFSWYPLHAQLVQAANMGDAVKELLGELPQLNLSEEQLSLAGQAVFEAAAIRREDWEAFVALRGLRQSDRDLDLKEQSGRTRAKHQEVKIEQKERELRLAEAKFRRTTCELFLKWYDSEKAKEILSGGGTNAQKIDALGQAMFGADWAD